MTLRSGILVQFHIVFHVDYWMHKHEIRMLQLILITPQHAQAISILEKFCASVALASCIISDQSVLKQLEVIKLKSYLCIATIKQTYFLCKFLSVNSITKCIATKIISLHQESLQGGHADLVNVLFATLDQSSGEALVNTPQSLQKLNSSMHERCQLLLVDLVVPLKEGDLIQFIAITYIISILRSY